MLRLDLKKSDTHIPDFAYSSKLPSEYADWPAAESGHQYSCTFSRMSEHFKTPEFRPPDDPFECTLETRNLALSKWCDFLNHAIRCLIQTKGEPYTNNTHFSSPIATIWTQNTQEWLLGRMVKWSRRLHMEHTIVGTIMYSLGIDADKRDHCGKVSQLEARKWRYVKKKTLEYKSLYDDMASSYMQVMSLRESQISNEQARSVARITILGAFFVPVSLTAGILSMAEPFTPGQEKFWVFLAIAGPFVIGLSAWVLFQQVIRIKARPSKESAKIANSTPPDLSRTLPVHQRSAYIHGVADFEAATELVERRASSVGGKGDEVV
jgi:hypothetical protein